MCRKVCACAGNSTYRAQHSMNEHALVGVFKTSSGFRPRPRPPVVVADHPDPTHETFLMVFQHFLTLTLAVVNIDYVIVLYAPRAGAPNSSPVASISFIPGCRVGSRTLPNVRWKCI